VAKNDTLGRLADTSLRSSTNVVLNQHQYQYSGHLRSKMTRTDGSYQDYTHDGADQLKTALTYTSGGTPIGGENRGYVYDAAGNLNTRTNNAAVQSFGVDSVNQLNSSPVGTVAYDDNGNLTTRSTATLSYDDENQWTRAMAASSFRVLVVPWVALEWELESEYYGKQS